MRICTCANHTNKTLGLHKNLGLHASGQDSLQKVFSAKHLEPGFKNNPRQNVSEGCRVPSRDDLAYLVIQPPMGMTMTIGLLGGGGVGHFGVEPADPVRPHSSLLIGGGGGGSPLAGAANAGASVEIKSVVARTRAIALRQFMISSLRLEWLECFFCNQCAVGGGKKLGNAI
jgi:hypothetical protein